MLSLFIPTGVASVQGFAPTIAKQLGYSPMVVGSVFTYLSMLSFFVKPIIGIIVDKFRVKRIMFLTFVLLCGLTAFSLKFIQKIPTEAVANLSCDTITALNVCSNDDNRLSQCDDSLLKLILNSAEPIECQVRYILIKCNYTYQCCGDCHNGQPNVSIAVCQSLNHTGGPMSYIPSNAIIIIISISLTLKSLAHCLMS